MSAKRRAKEGNFTIFLSRKCILSVSYRLIFCAFVYLSGILQAVGAHHATEDIEFDKKLRYCTIIIMMCFRFKHFKHYNCV